MFLSTRYQTPQDCTLAPGMAFGYDEYNIHGLEMIINL